MRRKMKGVSFFANNFAKAFFKLDLSRDGPSVAAQTHKPRDRNDKVAPPPPATGEVDGNNKVSLLTLPIEIRLRIYEELLVSWFDRKHNPSWAVGKTNQQQIMVGLPPEFQYTGLEPAILRTCKQIHYEAISTLYSQNVFRINWPTATLRLITQIGTENVKMIRKLIIQVPWTAKLSAWLQVLRLLAEEASGLRSIRLGWGADVHERHGRGLGDNVEFARALGRIQGLDELVIGGCYAKNWPAYFGERMGVQVREIPGPSLEEYEESTSDFDYEYFSFLYEIDRWLLEEYQKGTEDLMP